MNFINKKNENYELVSENRVGIDKIAKFLKKNVKYVSKGTMIFALALVLMLTTACNEKNDGEEQPQTEQEQTPGDAAEQPEVKKDEYEVDAHPEVKELISTYYDAYAAGDMDKLDSITQYLSDMEKSYISMLKEYVESYSDVTCYTKDGLEEGSFMVSATFSMNLSGTEGGLPGMDFFYIRTDDEGKLYIDNRYSSFNREIEEQETEQEINDLIDTFEDGDDVQQLRTEVQDKYSKAIEENENLKQMADTVKEAIRQWKDSYTPEEPKEEEQPEENTDQQDEASAESPEEPAENQEQAPEEAPQEAEAPQEDTTPEINYVPEGKVLTSSKRYNVRKSMDETSDIVGTTEEGDSITVILSYAEGWTKVEWNGQTGYIRTDLLLNN